MQPFRQLQRPIQGLWQPMGRFGLQKLKLVTSDNDRLTSESGLWILTIAYFFSSRLLSRLEPRLECTTSAPRGRWTAIR